MKNFFRKIISICLTVIMILSCVLTGFAENETNNKDVLLNSSSKIYIDEEKADIKGYLIENNNYFKLRDIAASLSDTDKCFQVEYDSEKNRINLIIGDEYEDDGSQTYVPPSDKKDIAIKTKSVICTDDETIELDAYNINGNNYVKLRDVAKLIDFALMYYYETQTVKFLTDKDYSQSKDYYPENFGKENGKTTDAESGESNNTEPVTKPVEVPEVYNKEVLDGSGQYGIELLNEYSKYFVNHVDGYKIMVNKSLNVDMSISEFRTVLSNDDLRIEIYNQSFENGSDFSSYVNYGNHFVSDTSLYNKVASYNTTIAGYSSYVLEWNRAPLGRVMNDKCYYASVDVRLASDRALTFLFKSSKPFDVADGGKSYINIVNTLSTATKTANAVVMPKSSLNNTKWDFETRNFYNTYFVEKSNVTWGIFEPLAPFSFTKLNSIETNLNHNFKFLVYYISLKSDIAKLDQVLTNVSNNDRTVELTFQTLVNSEGQGNMLIDTLNGKYDDFLDKLAKTVAKNGKPMLFRLGNEMNGDWCPYSAYQTSKDTELYKEFYKYVHKIFEKNGALKNTIWVWNPNWKSYPDYDWNHALCYYPGDEYVDVVGLTAYNTGTYYSGEKWTEFQTLYDRFYYQYCVWFNQPLMITEFACSSYGGDKATWVNNMLKKMSDYNRIKVAIWWSSCDFDAGGNVSRPYYIDDNLGVIQAFKNYFTINNE